MHTSNEVFRPPLYFTEDMPIVKEDEYVFRHVVKQLPDLEANQMAIHLFQVLSHRPLHVIALFQNTLSRSFHLNDLVVLALSGDELVARKVLSIEEVPVILPMATLPLWLTFEEDECFVDLEQLTEPLQLVFSSETLTELFIEDDSTELEQRMIRQVAYSHPTPPADGWSLLPVSITRELDTVTAIVLVRNASDQTLTLEALTLELMNDETPIADVTHPGLSLPAYSQQAIRLRFSCTAPHVDALGLRYLPPSS